MPKAARLLLRFYVTIFGIFKPNKPKKVFFLVRNLQIYMVFTPPTGFATAEGLLLLFYVTIFSNFKPNKQFSNKNLEKWFKPEVQGTLF